MIEAKRVLVLGPHPDDAEFGCGGTIARYLEAGAEVRTHVFSLCEESLPGNLKADDIRGELFESCKVLGIAKDKVTIGNYRVRRFNESRQDILEEIIKERDGFQPEIVFVPASTDIHQDHQVIAREGLRAYKHANVFGYELPWNTVSFDTSAILEINAQHLDRKISALKAYQSQSFRPYFQDSFVRSLARVRGTQAAKEFAEAFEAIRINM